jgi:putative glycosyltransferase (TIGR04348 family)
MRLNSLAILIVTPAAPGSRKGNRITALRWSRILRGLGHRVRVAQHYHGQRCDVLVALHARRSHTSLARFRRLHPERPLLLALTGTDLYRDIRGDRRARQSLELASRLIVLQPRGIRELAPHLRKKACVILQSVEIRPTKVRPALRDSAAPRPFRICVLGHLRPVKDPFRTPLAVRRLPESSRIEVLHVGAALSKEMERRARAEQAVNPRYRWLGELPRWKALQILARCQLLALTSELEGGANVISEALAVSVPVVSSRIAGSIGLLGDDYPGYFPVHDTRALATLLCRTERDSQFYRELKQWCMRLKPLVDPARERNTWDHLLRQIIGEAATAQRGNTTPRNKRS